MPSRSRSAHAAVVPAAAERHLLLRAGALARKRCAPGHPPSGRSRAPARQDVGGRRPRRGRPSESTATRAGGCSTRSGSTVPGPTASPVLIRSPPAAATSMSATSPSSRTKATSSSSQRLRPAEPGLRFTRNGAGGYDVARIDGAFRTALGTPAHAGRRRQRAGERAVRVLASTARTQTRRSSTPTATSPSRRRTARAPSATSRGC